MIVRSWLLLLLLLALSSCVPKGIGGQSRSQQGLSQQALMAKPSSVSTKEGAFAARSNLQSPENGARGLTSAGQESDINREISPYIGENTVISETSWPMPTAQAELGNHDSEMIGFFLADRARGLVYSLDKNGQAWLWQPAKGRVLKLFDLGHPVQAAALNADTRQLAVAGASSVDILSAVTGDVRYQLSSLRTRAASLRFQPKRPALLIGGVDGEVYRWKFSQPPSDKSLERYFGHSNVVSSAEFHPLGRVFFTGDWSGALNAWLPYDEDDRYAGEYDRKLFGVRAFSDQETRMRAPRTSTASIEHLSISPDGETLLVAGQDGTLEWWSVRGFTLRNSVQAHKGLIYSLALSPSGKVVATSGRDGKVRTWRLTSHTVAASNTVTYAIEPVNNFDSVSAAAMQFLDETTLAEVLKDGQVVAVRIS